MIFILLTCAMVLWAPSNGAAASKRQQTLDIPDMLVEPRNPDKERAPSTTTPEPELPLYQPATINIHDFLGSPPTTMAAPYVEPVDMDYDHRKVYRIRGDYDIRMKTLDKIAKERKRALEERKRKAQRRSAKPRAEDEPASIDDEDAQFHTRRRKPGVKGRPETRGRGIPKPEFEPGRRPGRRGNPIPIPPLSDPAFEPDSDLHPDTPPMKPGFQPGGRGGLRKAGRRRTPAPKGRGSTQSPPGRSRPSDGRPAVSTELKHGVKIVSEPGVKPRQAPEPSPTSETPTPAPLPGKGIKSEEQSKDELISSRLVEALEQEPLLPYEKVVDEDTTEAVDVSRLVQESPFNFKLRELEEQQEIVEDNMSLDEREEPDPGLSPIEDNEKDGGEEVSNVHVVEKQPASAARPQSAREQNATLESDLMVEIEDLGFVLGTRNNESYSSSASPKNLLVPVVDDSYTPDDLVNLTTNATSAGGLGVEHGVKEDDITNLSRTAAKMKRKKYSIASRVRLLNDSLITSNGNITVGKRTRLRTRRTNKTIASSPIRLVNYSLNTSNGNFTVEKRTRLMTRRTNKTIASSPIRLVNDSLNTSNGNVTVEKRTRLSTRRTNKIIASPARLVNDSLNTVKDNLTVETRTRTRLRKRLRAVSTNKTIAPSPIRLVNDSLNTAKGNVTVETMSRLKTRSTNKTIASSPITLVNDSSNTAKGNVAVEKRMKTRSTNKTRDAEKSNAAPEIKTSSMSLPRVARGGKNARNPSKARRGTVKSRTLLTTNQTKSLGNTNESEPLSAHISEKKDNCTLALPKNHPPLTYQVDPNELLSKWKYFGEKVAPTLPNASTTPQEFIKTVSAIRHFIKQHNVSHQSIDSDFFRKSRILSGIFTPSKKGVSVNFFLFTRNSTNATISLQNDMASLQGVPVNADTKLQVICHDFGQGASERWIKQLKDALLNEDKHNVVLVVGWRRAASRNYWTAAANARPVGRKLACLLGRLRNERGLPLRSVHVVGLGLGAHVARHAAVAIIHRLCEKIGRVTGLDVSAPLFEEFNETLNADVAEYVDLIHTSTDFVHGLRGQVAATGHVDYYTGGALSSSDCPEAKNDIRRDCSRALSAELFLRSVRGDCAYRSTSCAPWSGRDECSGCGPRGCGRMGFRSPSAHGTGAQFLHTQTREPYCDVKAILAE